MASHRLRGLATSCQDTESGSGRLGKEDLRLCLQAGPRSGGSVTECASPLPIQPPCRVGLEDGADLVADAAEDGELLFLRAGSVCGIVEGEMVAVHLAGEHGA